MKKLLLTSVVAMLSMITTQASDIKIKSKGVTSVNTIDKKAELSFDIDWNYSWRTGNGEGGLGSGDATCPTCPNNHDAIWVFAKYRKQTAPGVYSDWTHLKLESSGHTAPSGAVIKTGLVNENASYNSASNPGVGVFVYRANRGLINSTTPFNRVVFSDLKLNFDLASNGLATSDQIQIRLFGIEMTYVTPGSYELGSAGSEVNKFRDASADAAVTISNYNSLSNVRIRQGSTGSTLNALGTLNANYPIATNGYYMMKYEISQAQYVAFLNTLPASAASANYIDSMRNNPANDSFQISVTAGVYSTPYPFYPMIYMNWATMCNYLAWAGLRPVSEFEYEKAARGTSSSISGEFAWGDATLPVLQGGSGGNNRLYIIYDNRVQKVYYFRCNGGSAPNTNTNGFASNCTATDTVSIVFWANYGNYFTHILPLSTFTKSNTDRKFSGSGFYGIYELSGNAGELCLPVSNTSYDGLHGNGSIGQVPASWNSSSTNAAIVRGGDFRRGGDFLRVSDRSTLEIQQHRQGGRGVRTAPSL